MIRYKATHIKLTIEHDKICLDLHTQDGELVIIDGVDISALAGDIERAQTFIESGGMQVGRGAIDGQVRLDVDCA